MIHNFLSYWLSQEFLVKLKKLFSDIMKMVSNCEVKKKKKSKGSILALTLAFGFSSNRIILHKIELNLIGKHTHTHFKN